jgi:hypothetical protein
VPPLVRPLELSREDDAQECPIDLRLPPAGLSRRSYQPNMCAIMLAWNGRHGDHAAMVGKVRLGLIDVMRPDSGR